MMHKYCTLVFLIFASLLSFAQTDNPFIADPSIFYHKGVYYLYGTGGGNKDDGFKVFTSTDKFNWEDKGYVLKSGESFGTKGFWAPQVFEYNDKFYIAYTANELIAIANADSPLGPFTQKNLKPIPSDVRMIDPFVFLDNGKVFLYHVRLDNGNRIFVAEMKKDLSEIDPSSLKECINASEKWEDTQNVEWNVAEGPTVLKHEGNYYLIYSANDFRNPDYAIGHAISKSPTGPWKKYSGNPILSKKDVGINGTGHGDIFFDGNKKMNYVFHTHFSNEKVGKRRTAVVEMQFAESKNTAPVLMTVPGSFKFLQTLK